MQHLSEQIMAHAEQLPEGAALAAKGLLHTWAVVPVWIRP